MKRSARSILASVVAGLTLVAVAACGTLTAGTPAAAPITPSGATSSAPSTPPPVTVTVTTIHTTTHIATKTTTATPTPTAEPTTSMPVPPSTPRTQSTAPQGTQDAAIRTETGQAVRVVQEYWTDLFVSWDVVWAQPSLWHGDGFYDSALWPSAGLGPYCGQPAPADNAFYCVGPGYLAWDMQLFRDNAYLGDTFVYVLVAHETAHAAQARFIADGQAPAVLAQKELQADCIGGATLAGAEKAGYLVLEAGDREEMVNAVIAAGSAAPGEEHGTSAERLSWFEKGYTGDIESCLGNR